MNGSPLFEHLKKNINRAIELSGREKFDKSPCFVGSEAHISQLEREIQTLIAAIVLQEVNRIATEIKT